MALQSCVECSRKNITIHPLQKYRASIITTSVWHSNKLLNYILFWWKVCLLIYLVKCDLSNYFFSFLMVFFNLIEPILQPRSNCSMLSCRNETWREGGVRGVINVHSIQHIWCTGSQSGEGSDASFFTSLLQMTRQTQGEDE